MPIAVEGLIRDGGLRIKIHMPTLESADVSFDCGGSIINTTWPVDFSVTPIGDGYSGQIYIRSISRLSPFASVNVQLNGKDIKKAESWHLGKLYAFTEEEFEAIFFRVKNRVRDDETLHFAANQIIRHYRHSDAHRCVAAVVLGYRSADSMRPAVLSDAALVLAQQLKDYDRLSLTGDARTDRNHLTLSMYMALWHVHLAMGDKDNVISTLDCAIEYCKTLKQPMSATAYNGCRMILLRGFIDLKKGDKNSARELFELNYDFYSSSFRDRDLNAGRFREKQDAHIAVVLSLSMLQNLSSYPNSRLDDDVFDLVNRVKQDSAKGVLRKNFDTLWL